MVACQIAFATSPLRWRRSLVYSAMKLDWVKLDWVPGLQPCIRQSNLSQICWWIRNSAPKRHHLPLQKRSKELQAWHHSSQSPSNCFLALLLRTLRSVKEMMKSRTSGAHSLFTLLIGAGRAILQFCDSTKRPEFKSVGRPETALQRIAGLQARHPQ